MRLEVGEGVAGRVLAGAFVGEHGEQGGGEVLRGPGTGHPRQHARGELAQLGGAGRRAQDLADERVGEQEVTRGEPAPSGEGARALLAVGGPEHVQDVGGESVGVQRGAGFEMRADGGGHRVRSGERRGAERGLLPRRTACVRGGSLAGGAHELLEVHAGLGDHGVLADVGAEDGAGEVEHGGGGVGPVAESGGGGDRGEVHAARRDLVQDQAQAPQQHAHIGALRTVVGVELVEHQIAQRGGRRFPERPVGAAQQQLVEHLVVRQQHVRGGAADHLAVGDEPVRGDDGGGLAGRLPGVQRGGEALVRRGLGEDLREAAGLVVGERVHRVEDQRLDPADPGLLRAGGVVEHGVEEGLGLAGAGAGGDDRGLREAEPGLVLLAGHVRGGGEAGEGGGLVGVGLEPVRQAGHELACGGGIAAAGEGQAGAQVGAQEDPGALLGEEGVQRARDRRVCERDRGGHVVDDRTAQVCGLPGGQQLRHDPSSSIRRVNSA